MPPSRLSVSDMTTTDQHLTPHDLAGLRGRTLAPERLLAVTRHLSRCSTCSRSAQGTFPIPSAAGELGQPLHPSYEELTAHLAAKPESPEWTRVAQHLELCRGCAAEVSELRMLDAKLEADSRVPVEAAVERPGAFEWLRRFLGIPDASPAFAGVSLCAVVLGALLLTVQAVPGGGSVPGNGSAAYEILHPIDILAARFAIGWTIAAAGACGLLYNWFGKKK